MKQKSVILMIALVTLTSCPEYGEKLNQWVQQNAYSYSKALATEDITNRWYGLYGELSNKVNSNLSHTNSRLIQVHKKLNEIDKFIDSDSDSIQGYIKTYDETRLVYSELSDLKPYNEWNKSAFARIDTITSKAEFEISGMRAVGRESLLRSFWEIGDLASKTNNERFKIFYVRSSFSYGNDRLNHENTNIPIEGPYDGSFEGFLATTFPFSIFYSIWEKDKVEEQNEKVKEAIVAFDKLAVSPEEIHKISIKIHDKVKKQFEVYLFALDTLQKQFDSTYSETIKATILRMKIAERALRPEIIRSIDSGSERFYQLFEGQKKLEVFKQAVSEIKKIRIIKNQIESDTTKNKIDRFILLEEYEDRLINIELSLSYYGKQKSFMPWVDEFDVLKKRVLKERTTLNDFKSNFQVK